MVEVDDLARCAPQGLATFGPRGLRAQSRVKFVR